MITDGQAVGDMIQPAAGIMDEHVIASEKMGRVRKWHYA